MGRGNTGQPADGIDTAKGKKKPMSAAGTRQMSSVQVANETPESAGLVTPAAKNPADE